MPDHGFAERLIRGVGAPARVDLFSPEPRSLAAHMARQCLLNPGALPDELTEDAPAPDENTEG